MNFKDMPLDELVKYFDVKKKDIEIEGEKVKVLVDVLKKEFEDKVDKLPEAMEFNEKYEIYRAEMKAAFGITEREPADVLNIIKTIKRMIDAPKSSIITRV